MVACKKANNMPYEHQGALPLWDNPFPEIVKCQLCSHLISKGEISACCEACPTGASLFGPVIDLHSEAQRRMEMIPGEYYNFPVAAVSSGKIQSHKARTIHSFDPCIACAIHMVDAQKSEIVKVTVL